MNEKLFEIILSVAGGSLTIIGIVLWFEFKRIVDKLDKLFSLVMDLNIGNATQEGKIKMIEDKVTTHENRINRHAEDIRDIKKVQDQCPNCTGK